MVFSPGSAENQDGVSTGDEFIHRKEFDQVFVFLNMDLDSNLNLISLLELFYGEKGKKRKRKRELRHGRILSFLSYLLLASWPACRLIDFFCFLKYTSIEILLTLIYLSLVTCHLSTCRLGTWDMKFSFSRFMVLVTDY